MELKNYDELIPQIARLMMDHDKAHTGYQEDIYLYVDEDGTGTLELFQNVGGNSWLSDDHYTLHCMKECYTDWTDTFQEVAYIADALGWKLDVLKERVAAWRSEHGEYTVADDVDFSDVRDFIEEHQPLLDKMYEAEDQCFEEAFSDYVDAATETLDSFLQEVE